MRRAGRATAETREPGQRRRAAPTPCHDLRHSGNAWAATSGAGPRDLMARMGHDSERTAIIYQHQARGADAVITQAIDAHADVELRLDDEGDGESWPVVPVG